MIRTTQITNSQAAIVATIYFLFFALLCWPGRSQEGPVLQGDGPLSGSCGGGGAAAAAASCPVIPAVFQFEFDSSSIGAVNGTLVQSWSNTGLVAGATGTNPSGDTYKPIYETGVLGGKGVVSFDGVADALEIEGTTASAAFLHNTQIFDIVVVMRPDRTTYQTFLASTISTTEKGVLFDLDNGLLCYRFLDGDGTAALTFCPYSGLPSGAWNSFELRSDASVVTATKNWTAVQTASWAQSPVAGNATNRLTIGAGPGTQAYAFDGAIAYLGIANRVLTAQERLDLKAALECRYGVL